MSAFAAPVPQANDFAVVILIGENDSPSGFQEAPELINRPDIGAAAAHIDVSPADTDGWGGLNKNWQATVRHTSLPRPEQAWNINLGESARAEDGLTRGNHRFFNAVLAEKKSAKRGTVTQQAVA